MRTAFMVPLLLLMVTPVVAQPEPSDISPAVSADRNEAAWADWEAQSRMTDGDYDGAVEAQRQADVKRQEADRQEMLARSSKR